MYPISYSYVCRSSSGETGHICTYKTQYGERKLEDEIKAIIINLVNNQNFSNLIHAKLSEGLDTDKLLQDREDNLRELRRLEAAQSRTEALLTDLDYTDKQAERREQSLQRRLDAIFDQIAATEERLGYITERLENAQHQKQAQESIIEFLEHFQDYYDIMEDIDKKALLCALIDSIELHTKTKQSGQWIKTVNFAFPMLYHGEEIVSLTFSPSESHVESIVCLTRK